MSNLSVMHITGCIDPRVGGPAQSLYRLCLNLKKFDVQSSVFSFHFPFDDRKIKWDNVDVRHVPYNFFSRYAAGWNPSGARILQMAAEKGKFRIIHNLGLWLYPNRYARITSKKQKVPLITSIRGMLGPWALKQKEIKKRIAWFIHEKKNLEAADAFHATSEQEAGLIRDMGFKQPIAVISNGIEVPQDLTGNNRYLFPEFQNKRILLYVARIDPIKGLERLIDIWKEMCAKYPLWHLVIAGTGNRQYVQGIERYILQRNLKSRITCVGFVEGDYKNELLSRAELFILPSFSENFSNSVAEALAYSVPVIATNGTPWKLLNERQCGWYTENNISGIKDALDEALALSPQCLSDMGKKGRSWVKESYAWPQVAKKMAETYYWMLNQGCKPDCII